MIPLRREYNGSPEVTAVMLNAVKELRERKVKKVKTPKSKQP